jgi:mRNA interferase RelE/StbE
VPYEISLTPRAADELSQLPEIVRKRVARWLDRLAVDPHCPGTRKLQGREDLFRAHAGKDHVIVYKVTTRQVLVVLVADRKDVYRQLSRRRER